jgi:hypothetical protein
MWLTMKRSDSPIILFVRSMTLLVTLIAVPGIAVCWNHLPKDLWKKSVSPPEKQIFHQNKNSDEIMESISVFAPESNYPALPEPDALPVIPVVDVPIQNSLRSHDAAIQQVAWEHLPAASLHDFATLEYHLKALGAKYYRLEKWGNRGELFRFSCFVTPSQPLGYEKHFQAIGSDEISVMKTVIADIEKWKKQ